MADLHAWITAQVAAVERAPMPHREACEHLPQVTSCCGSPEYCDCFVTFPCDCDVPASIARHCEADRQVLAVHCSVDNGYSVACEGCGYDGGHCPDPITDNVNDCPILLALAHAHGITDEILAGLDRPGVPVREPRGSGVLSGLLPDIWGAQILRSLGATPIRDVPPALRGPNWKGGSS